MPPEAWWPAGIEGLRSRRVSLASGLTVRVVEGGPPGGAPVLLVHGWGVHSFLWRHTVPALVGAGCRVYAVDLPGHGLSDKPVARGSYTLDSLTAHVVALMDALEVSAASIVAQSMGGRVATEVALRHPDRVRALALFGSVGFGVTTIAATLAARLPAPRGAFAMALNQRWIVALGRAYSYGRRATVSPDDIDAYWAATQFPDFIPALHQTLVEFDWRPLSSQALESLASPALVVFGTRDRMVRPVGLAARIAAMPNGRLHIVRDAGHVANEEAPDEVNPLLVEFLGAHG